MSSIQAPGFVPGEVCEFNAWRKRTRGWSNILRLLILAEVRKGAPTPEQCKSCVFYCAGGCITQPDGDNCKFYQKREA